jgi:Adenosine deaminase
MAALPLAGVFCAAGANADTASEAAAAAIFDKVAGNAAQLRMFLQAMPKGGDLHNHMGGNIYAEDFLQVAARDDMCADDKMERIVRGPCAQERRIAKLAEADPFTYGRLVDALSTRGYQRGVGADQVSGHTQFFTSFDKFSPAFAGQMGRWIALTRASAARNRVSYVELMRDPRALVEYAMAGGDETVAEADLPAVYDKEIGAAEAAVTKAIAEADREDAEAHSLQSCGTAAAEPGCNVAMHYLTFAWRGKAPAIAYRSLIAGFVLAHRDPRFVGVNIVMPEDDPVALRDYDLHMAMFRFLQARYPDVKVTMHAGELALGLVAPQELEDHIAKAIASGARRIGHGTDIAYEQGAPETLARMARDKIAVEVNLTSNAVILGVEGGEHPLKLYRSMGVPVALSTDDEGVLRSDMTNEFRRAAMEQGLSYRDLKELARASLEYSFVPGASYWRGGDFGRVAQSCATATAAAACQRFLAANEKARLQADLEKRFEQFERDLGRFERSLES